MHEKRSHQIFFDTIQERSRPMDTAVLKMNSIRKGDWTMQNVNMKNRHGHTPLMEAAKNGDIPTTTDLLKRGADVDALSEKEKTALHYAAANGHVEVVKLLLEHGAVIDARDRDGHTPLMLAAIYGCNHTVQALLVNSADIHVRTKAGNTALVYAENNNHPITLALLKKAQRPKEATA
jgi:ankyrin repeat protein